jgi:predicted metal-dependent hydrolase
MNEYEIRSVSYGSRKLTYDLSFSNRKTLAISVHPDGSISVTAPISASQVEIDKRVHEKAQWITAKQLAYADYSSKWPSTRFYVSGSLHPYLGRLHRLRFITASEWTLALRSGVFELRGPVAGDTEEAHRTFDIWYSRRAKWVFAEQLEKALVRFPSSAAVSPEAVSSRPMKRRWGSMTANGRLLLNSRLIEHAKPQIEYVITHELAHRIVPDHSARFWKALERAMPDWRERKQKLEGAGSER